jgi:hypothetical protein
MDIVLQWKYLKYDIDQETWKCGNCQITSENAEVRSEAQTGEDSFDRNYCQRKIDEGVGRVRNILHKFCRDYGEYGEDSLETDKTSWHLQLEMDGRRSVGSHDVASAVHRYIVMYVLSEWTKMALPSMSEAYMGKLSDSEVYLRRITWRKNEPVRHKEERNGYEEM